MMSRFVAIILGLMLVAPFVSAGPYEDGLVAYRADNYAQAIKLWHPLADQGNAIAQYNLGVMYANGEGVPQSYLQAHLWFNLAASQGVPEAVTNRNSVAVKMTAAQVTEAQRLAANWKPKLPQS